MYRTLFITRMDVPFYLVLFVLTDVYLCLLFFPPSPWAMRLPLHYYSVFCTGYLLLRIPGNIINVDGGRTHWHEQK
jgi:hypothetical protein